MTNESNQIIPLLASGLIFLLLVLGACTPSQDEAIDFNQDIRPILSDRCFSCHGPDKAARKADLRLDTPEGAREYVLESGNRAFVPHSRKGSEGLQRMLSQDPELQMPPPESQLSLLPEEIKLISQWIDQGAPYAPHWSFIPPVKASPPVRKDDTWSKNAIDQFVVDGLAMRGIKPQEEAHKEALIRRVSFDIRGLPPKLEEIDTF